MEQRNHILKTGISLYAGSSRITSSIGVFGPQMWHINQISTSLLLFVTVASTAERFGTSVEPKWEKKVTFENELICFENKICLKTRRNA